MEAYQRWKKLLSLSFQLVLMTCFWQEITIKRPIIRTCKRLPRLQGWWETVWSTFNDKRFKQNFRMTKATFLFLLGEIAPMISKQTVTEDPITPEVRLAVCLYRLARGDYLHTIAELVGLGTATVSLITKEVCEALVSRLWDKYVNKNMPKDLNSLRDTMESFDREWQFQCCFGAVDGCHIPIKCPNGGAESAKEYHNFKGFYSVVVMAIVDAHYRFSWASSGYPGNSHDAIIFQSTSLFHCISDGSFIPNYSKKDGEVDIYPTLIGDSAFPFLPWLMKPYGSAVLTEMQRYFNYRLSRARMVVEGAFGQLKGRWRILQRKNESKVSTVRIMSLACIILHNICIDVNDKCSSAWDLSVDPNTKKKRPQSAACELLHMTRCRKIPDTSRKAGQIRDYLKQKFWDEKQGKGVH